MRQGSWNLRPGLAARGVALVAGIALAGALTGCDDDYIYASDCPPPAAPVAIYSVTGDGEVTVYWTGTDERNTREFVIYRAPTPEGTYREVGHTRRDWFTDFEAQNGVTYFYAVSAVNDCGYESDLSREIAQDTPRPEGRGSLDDANGPDWRRSGWDFSAERAVAWDAAGTDILFLVDEGTPWLLAADLDTDLQDAGYAGFDDVGWAPDGGWSRTGAVEAVEGHCYIVWTRDNHYAKVRVLDVNDSVVVFDWAYQIDAGNPELKPRPERDGASGPLQTVVPARKERNL